LVVGAVISAAAATMPRPAQAAAARQALVIGNGTYSALPALQACLLSAHAVAAALRGAEFDVVEREDATTGGFDAAIAEAGRHLADNAGAPAFVYVCVYATSFNDRAFLLPTTANIARPADVFTQGVLAKSLLDLLTRSGVRAAVLAFDVVPAPIGSAPGGPAATAPGASGLDALAQGTLPDSLGYIAVSQGPPPAAPTPLATSFVADLKGTTVQAGSLLAAVRQQLGASKAATLVALHAPTAPAYLIGTPAPPPQAVDPAVAALTAALMPRAAPASPVTPATSSASAPTTVPGTMPAEEHMTEADRRRVQSALVQLGYYDGKADGTFGGDTRAAIRRFQHELGSAMTGRLTAEQATKLVAGR